MKDEFSEDKSLNNTFNENIQLLMSDIVTETKKDSEKRKITDHSAVANDQFKAAEKYFKLKVKKFVKEPVKIQTATGKEFEVKMFIKKDE